ncbi:extracellular solute-binding protein [Clostridium perfringens]|nr:extracellular solute-binding protein [Clostridium perfringens]MDK0751356.1 extracellular solute-binding protein [Clostridium perfringens]MDK0763668.1 extracellular solute-binding protein [Clostridium perfringens]MDM0888774.1 extracellular solute-binding protein [Clostridium perfringens]MDM0900565.1 extracellular solute-binding protein [Clostridium perfringens]
MKLKFPKLRTLFIILIIILILLICIVIIKKNNNHSIPDLSDKHIVVYSCLREEETKSILELFKEETNCSYEYIQLPTQEAISRIEDEKNAPKADIFLSGSKLSLQKLEYSDSLAKYISSNNQYINKNFKSKYGRWIAFEVHPFSIVINMNSWNKNFKNLKIPTTFEDLANPNFKNAIVMPNPLTSGTGFSFLSHLYDSLGEEKYKKIIKQIQENTGLLSTRGYNVVQNVVSGEYPIGISYLSNVQLMQKTDPNFIIITPNNFGIDLHGVAIINKKTNLDTAKAFVNFIVSDKTQKRLKDFSYSTPILEAETPQNSIESTENNKENNSLNIWEEIQSQ